MTAIHNLPEEVLHAIFKQLDKTDVLKCQFVCKSWYSAAHKALLKIIRLRSDDQVQKFIKAIDLNPDPRYLASVRRIIIDGNDYEYDPEWQTEYIPFENKLTQDIIKKLFSRFPNLEAIENVGPVDLGIYSHFDEETCKNLQKSCPRLESFTASTTQATLDQLLNLRYLLTDIRLPYLNGTTYQNDPASFLTNFNHLKSLLFLTKTVNTVEKVLHIIEALPSLTKVEILDAEKDSSNFAERYLATKTRVEQDIFLERLSKVTEFHWHRYHSICVNAIQFIDKYLTGLKSVNIHVKFTDRSIDWEDYKVFCNTMLDICCSSRMIHYKFDVEFQMDGLSAFFNSILQKVYQQPVKTKMFEVYTRDDHWTVDTNLVDLSVTRTPVETKALLQIRGEYSLNKLMNVLAATPSLKNVDYFKVYPLGWQSVNFTVYEKMLGWMPSLKHFHFAIPERFEDAEPIDNKTYYRKIYPRMEEMTIRSCRGADFERLLNKFSVAFPNLKRLNFYYFCGYWNQASKEVQLKLPNYSLRYLMIDLQAMKDQITSNHQWRDLSRKDFFVLKVECLGTRQLQFYKVTPKYLTATQLDKNDVKGLVNGKDYFKLHIIVNCLEKLELYVTKRESFEETLSYIEDEEPHQKVVIKLNEYAKAHT